MEASDFGVSEETLWQQRIFSNRQYMEQMIDTAHRAGPYRRNEVPVSCAEVPGFISCVSLT
jgi:hypothetical protein